MRKEIEIERPTPLLDVRGVAATAPGKDTVPAQPLSNPAHHETAVPRNQIRIARLYLVETGVTHEEMARSTSMRSLPTLALHGGRVSKMVALTICRGKRQDGSTLLWHGCCGGLVDDLWWQGREHALHHAAWHKSLWTLSDRSRRVNPLAPRTSQKRKGS